MRLVTMLDYMLRQPIHQQPDQEAIRTHHHPLLRPAPSHQSDFDEWAADDTLPYDQESKQYQWQSKPLSLYGWGGKKITVDGENENIK